jgi:phospholipase C
MYVVSPWSKGGWVNSQTFDHTSVGQFLEKRFDLTIPAISPWHRKMCGDMTSCFDFSMDGDRAFPPLPDAKGSQATLAQHLKRPKIMPPRAAEELFQEQGLRRARPLPYVLHVDATADTTGIALRFINDGTVGVTFQVYDKRHLDRLPRRYAVEAGKSIDDRWIVEGDGFDLFVLGPNGFMRSFTGKAGASLPALTARYDSKAKAITLAFNNAGGNPMAVALGNDLYGVNAPQTINVTSASSAKGRWPVGKSQGWYDFTVAANGTTIRLAGRLEDGKPGISDPLMHV